MFCPSCGAQNDSESGSCISCGAPLAADAAPAHVTEQSAGSAPASPVAASPADVFGDARLARLGDRLLAVILDTLLLVGVFAVVGMWAAIRWGGLTAHGFSIQGNAALVAISGTLVAGFLYYWFLEAVAGATLGKAIVGIRVRSKDGGRCSFAAALIRNLARIIDGIAVYLVGFLIAVFSKLRQRLGDHLAKTVVLETSGGGVVRALFVVVWLALLGGSIWGAYMIHRGAPASASTAPASTPAPVFTSTSTSTSVRTSAGASATIPIMSSGDIKILNFTHLQAKDGPPRASAVYKPEDRVFTSYEFAGLTTDSQGQVHTTDSVVALDPSGLPLYAPAKDTSNGMLSESKTLKNTFWFDIPPFAPAGTYKIQIKLHDGVKNTDAEFDPLFTVEAPPLPAFEHLEVRDFHLSLTQGGPAANPLVLESGGTVYLSGKIGGMQFREDRPDVQVSLVVTGPKGDKIFERPNFLVINDSHPYHPPTFFMSINGNLNIPAGFAKGTYTEKYIVTDHIANATANYEFKFQVR